MANEEGTESTKQLFGNVYLFVFWVIFLGGYVAANITVLTLAIIYSNDANPAKKKNSKILFMVALFLLVILVAVLAVVSAMNT